MDKKYTHCAQCSKAFEAKDEVTSTTANGSWVIVHQPCLYDWLLRWSIQEYYQYDELINELKEAGELDE